MSQKYANYDTDGNIAGFYADDIHSVIPEPNISITDDEWQDCLQHQGRRKVDTIALKIIECSPPEPTTEELLAAIRIKRDALLAESDWTALSDVPLADVKKAEWQAYRQALRDFPATCDPKNLIWPDKPK
jgi:hypothetical protein